MAIKAEVKGDPVILKEHIGGYYDALRLTDQEEIWIKDGSQHLIFNARRCGGVKRINEELFQCKLSPYHSGYC